ncbi:MULTISPECIES: helix-turn-helix transcriptional regulator [unclassified Streptomyces]|uniref:helix-turn-helix transcriptional regulator n=1 Tax=unclassified Streptomyces TaxID=2593676 RepID=UPI002DD90D15|nr:hypothetical protein [Streptomyces sp. NBC_01766]WSC24908.1 hypothetical protein OIE60_35155 [Streptomyces sp. NBC_01766]
MSQAAVARLVDTAAIVEEFSTTPSRISEWYRDRATTGFPDVHHAEGRKRFWEYDPVVAFFAAKADSRTARALPASVLEADQGELLTAAEVTALLGYKSKTSIYWYLANLPGYFPEPDDTIDGLRWRRGTIVGWVQSRPGKGRRTGSSRTVKTLPKVSAAGDPDELLGIPETAALLGFNSAPSFSSSLSQGNLPELAESETFKAEDGRPRKGWRRKTVLEVASRLGVPTGERPVGEDELLGAEEAAPILGYSSAASFNGALYRGRWPELDEPDATEAQTGGGKAQKKWTRKRLEKVAADRASS